jgi:hypothetical protein
MVDPIITPNLISFAIGIAVSAAGITGVIAVVYLILKIGDIVDWFRNRQKLRKQHKKALALTISGKIERGEFREISGVFDTDTNDYHLIQAFYNQETNEVLDCRYIQANEIDSQILDYHENSSIVIYD